MSASTDRSSSRPISWTVTAVVFFAGSVLLWADRTNFSVAAAAWAKEFGWTPATIGMMLSAFSLGYLILQPVGGWIADKAGARRTLAASMAGWSVWVLLTPIAPTVLWLTATFRVLLGAFEAPYIPASVAAVARAIPSVTRRGRFSAFVQSGAQLGPAAGVFFAGVILSTTGSATYIFLIFGLVGLAGAAAWWSYARNFDDPVPHGAHAETDEAKERAAQAPVPNRLLIASPALWPFYIGYFALPYCQYLFLTWLPQYLSHYRHIPLVQASALSALPFLVAFLASNFTGWAMDWLAAAGWTRGGFHRKLFVGLGAAIYAVTTLIAATTESNTLAVIMIIIANAGLSFYVVPFWTTCTDIAPNQTGTLGGVMNFFGIVGATLSPYGTGLIAQATGAFVAPLVLAVVIMLVASTTMILFFRYRPLSELVAHPLPAATLAAKT
ncbi:MAG TPA: MFS transporter [Xanthobacteraceae bacterium]|jgi:MFS family permease|nr:MFS transporter [Xanthobacteraceae bacterium]